MNWYIQWSWKYNFFELKFTTFEKNKHFYITKSGLHCMTWQNRFWSNFVAFSFKKSTTTQVMNMKSKKVPIFLGLFILLFTTIFVAFRDYVFEVEQQNPGESEPDFELFIGTPRSNVKVIKRFEDGSNLTTLEGPIKGRL